MKTRNGKIARLPRSIRDELNERMDNGQTEGVILPWLNSRPTAQAVLAAQFGARPVSQQNLTNWRRGGYQHWLEQQERRHLAREAVREVKELASNPNAAGLADQMSTFLVAQLAVSVRAAQRELTDPKEQYERLRAMMRTVGQARRGDYLTGRLALDRERQAFVASKKQRADCAAGKPASMGAQGQTN